jgi:hypothetical protein
LAHSWGFFERPSFTLSYEGGETIAMSKQHNESQIHVRSTSGKYRPGTTTPPQQEADAGKLSPLEQSYLAKGSDTPPCEEVAGDVDDNALWPLGPGLEAADIVEVLSGSMHTDEGDSVDPSSQE